MSTNKSYRDLQTYVTRLNNVEKTINNKKQHIDLAKTFLNDISNKYQKIQQTITKLHSSMNKKDLYVKFRYEIKDLIEIRFIFIEKYKNLKSIYDEKIKKISQLKGKIYRSKQSIRGAGNFYDYDKLRELLSSIIAKYSSREFKENLSDKDVYHIMRETFETLQEMINYRIFINDNYISKIVKKTLSPGVSPSIGKSKYKSRNMSKSPKNMTVSSRSPDIKNKGCFNLFGMKKC
jgi:chromosome segregation ATPase